jgi:nitrite reductase/ring-hydroxylating ferredoxin subunit
MAEFVNVGRVEDFREGRGKAVRVDDDKVAVFMIDGRLAAIQDSCPHMASALSDGKVEKGRVVCLWHGWSFDPVSGEGGRGSRTACVRVYDVRTKDGNVYVRRRDEPPKRDASQDEEWVVWDDRFLKPSSEGD